MGYVTYPYICVTSYVLHVHLIQSTKRVLKDLWYIKLDCIQSQVNISTKDQIWINQLNWGSAQLQHIRACIRVKLNITLLKFALFIFELKLSFICFLYEPSSIKFKIFKLDTELMLFRTIYYNMLVQSCNRNLQFGRTFSNINNITQNFQT